MPTRRLEMVVFNPLQASIKTLPRAATALPAEQPEDNYGRNIAALMFC
jgi:hypothetical protein